MKTILKTIICAFCFAALTAEVQAANVSYKLNLKQPGNAAVVYNLTREGNQLTADQPLPIVITQKETREGDLRRLTVTLTAQQRVYFNLGMALPTDFATDDCDFYLPGFWYHKNLRSPESAPSFHTSKSWNFREDRLSAPLTGVYDGKTGRSVVVMRQLDGSADALTTHQEGEVILGGRTSLGYVGFEQSNKVTKSQSNNVATQTFAELTFGYPWIETPKRYTRKLTLTPSATTFARLEAGESITLQEDNQLLNEVVVVGYGTMQRKDLTSSITTIKAEDMNRGVFTDPGQMLQGKVPGLVVTSSGDPNGTPSITLRGASSLRSGAMSPYYVIDGIPGVDISMVAPDDIESIDVLRDATATAIYGSKAANGVIIITTKKGAKERTNVSYNGYVAFDNVLNTLDMASADDIRDYVKKNNINYMYDGNGNTDWQDEVLRTGVSVQVSATTIT